MSSPRHSESSPHLPADADVDKISALATLLVAARNNAEAIASVPDELVPNDAVEAQLVDDHVAAISGWPVLGWKIGATSQAAQKALGASGPFAGRVYSILDNGADISSAGVLGEPRIEGEFAFTLAEDLNFSESGSSDAPDRAAVVAAIANTRPAIEVVGGRYADMFGMPLVCLMADAGANGLLVLGDPVDDVDLSTLPEAAATMSVDGEILGIGVGADVYGDPVEALVWLVGHLAERGVSLKAGQVVTTGTATQILALPAGATAVATLTGIGTVSTSRG
ncbi:MAG: 2-keto-4-pentenoate hydratase [Acidimicrobiales bacterium]